MNIEKKDIKNHNLILENRKSLLLSGVSDVDSFDEQTVIAYTDMGSLTIKGSDLKVNKLNTESGELNIEGNISSMSYSDETKSTGNFFSKIFK